MRTKYLYGKFIHLKPLIKGENGIRFSDLTHYSRLENEKMRDDEMKKIFIPRKDEMVFEINGYKLNPNDLAGDPIFSITPRHCYCLCMSNRGNDEELYRTFRADVCIAFNVDELERRLSICFELLKESYIIGKDIIYYDTSTLHGLDKSPDELVFYKPNQFSHESEYRIAWFYPLDKKHFRSKNKNIPIRFKDESSHMTVFHKEKDIITDCIVDVYRYSGC